MKKVYLALLGILFSGTVAFGQCNELFISEYIEGSGNNKALEIYNPTANPIDLSAYKVFMINNGGSSNDVDLQLSGTIGAYDVYVIANDGATEAAILAEKDTMLSYNSVVHFNGDDAIGLIKGSDTIDGIGERFNDPGSSWTVGTGSTKDNTLVRMSTVKAGTKDWTTGVNQWDVYSQNTTSNLGSHTCDCYVPAKLEVGFKTTLDFVSEDDGTYNAMVSISSAPSSDVTVSINVTGGTAMNGTEYTVTVPATLTFPAGNGDDQKLSIAINDNSMPGTTKTVELSLSNVMGNAVLTSDSMMTLNIENDDYRVSKISDAAMHDAELNITNRGELVEVRGIVHGPDFDGNAGYSFALIDSTGAINIFNFVDVSDYQATEGDDITVRGEIDFYNGLTEVKCDSIKLNSQGNDLVEPMKVDKPSEMTESHFIRIEKIYIADTTTVWPSNGNVWVRNDAMDTFQVRIDRDVADIPGEPVAYDTLTITGIGGQYDAFAPYDGGYQIFPRMLSDIEKWVDRSSVRNVNIVRHIYPNPSTGLVHVAATSNINRLVVSDLTGKVIASYEGSHSKVQTVDLSNLNKGVYLIHLNSGSTTGTRKVVLK